MPFFNVNKRLTSRAIFYNGAIIKHEFKFKVLKLLTQSNNKKCLYDNKVIVLQNDILWYCEVPFTFKYDTRSQNDNKELLAYPVIVVGNGTWI